MNQPNKRHLRKFCPENPTPGVDPLLKAERDKRDKEREANKKKKRQGGARVAGAGTDTDSDSGGSDGGSDCSDQSVYDDELETSVQSADVMLSSTFFTPGASSTVDVATLGSARVAIGEEQPTHSALAQVQAQMLAESRAHAAQLARSEHALLQAQRESAAAAAEFARLTGRAVAPSTPTPTAVLPSTATDDHVTVHSILALSAEGRAAITPLRRDDARRLVASLDPVDSPLHSMQLLARTAGLSEVRLGCGPPSGGSTVNRTKAHVLADMRIAVGLSPVAVPMGLPIETGGGNAASSPSVLSTPSSTKVGTPSNDKKRLHYPLYKTCSTSHTTTTPQIRPPPTGMVPRMPLVPPRPKKHPRSTSRLLMGSEGARERGERRSPSGPP